MAHTKQKINTSTSRPPGMAVLRDFVGSTTVSGEAATAPISSPAPAFIILRAQPKPPCYAGWCVLVPFESKRQPGSTFWNPQHRTEIIVNLKQPHKSQLFSVRLWSRSVIYKVKLENSCCIIYVNVFMKWMILRLKYAWHRLTVIWKHWHKCIISIWEEDL